MNSAAVAAGNGANNLATNVTSGADSAKTGMDNSLSGLSGVASANVASAANAAGSYNRDFHTVGNNAGVAVHNGFTGIDLGPAGNFIMNGLLNGILRGWRPVQKFISGVAGWIYDHKGPVSYDKKLLVEAGNSIMLGLNNGLTNGFGNAMSNVSGMAGNIANVMSGSAEYRVNAVSSGLNIGTDGTLSVDMSNQQRPATIILSMGGSTYRGFVDDISNQQGQTATLNRTTIV